METTAEEVQTNASGRSNMESGVAEKRQRIKRLWLGSKLPMENVPQLHLT